MRRPRVLLVVAALVGSLGLTASASSAATSAPLMPGVESPEWATTHLTADAAYLLVPDPGRGLDSLIYRRALVPTPTGVAIGQPELVAQAWGTEFAEDEGTIAYFARPDGDLALRAPDGTTTTPAWGQAGPGAPSWDDLSLSASWITVGGVLYDLGSGDALDLAELSNLPPQYGETFVNDVVVEEDRLVWTVFAYTWDYSGYYDAVMTTPMNAAGPSAAPTVLFETTDWDTWAPVVDLADDYVVWYLADPETGMVDWASWVPRTAVTATPWTSGPWSSTGPIRQVSTSGNTAVLYEATSGDQLHFIDLTAPGAQPPSEWFSSSEVLDVEGSYVARHDWATGMLYLDDLDDRTVSQGEDLPPSITRVEPPSGSRLGGTRVTLSGLGVTTATAVTFGGIPATDVEAITPWSIEVTAPAGAAAGPVPVVVTTPLGTTTAGSADFAYVDVATQSPVRAVSAPAVAPNQVTCQQITGSYGVPAGATGVVLNVTTVRPTGPGYVVVYPDSDLDGATPPPAGSTVNFEPGADVANSAMVELPSNGTLCWSTRGAASAGILMDVTGFTLPGSGMVTQASTRLLDTREGALHVGSVTGPVAPRQVYTVDVAGQAGVPQTATAVLLNVTVTGVTRGGNLRVFPAGQAVPNTSVINYAPGQDKANATIVTLPVSGEVSFYSDAAVGVDVSPVQVILDVVGYVEDGAAYVGVSPTRVMDTRLGALQTGPLAGPLTPRTVYTLPIAGLAGVPADASAVVLNITAIGPTANGNLRVYPDEYANGTTPPPNASSINYIIGRDIPNQVVVALPSSGRISFYSDQGSGPSGPGSVNLAADVVGYVTGG